MYIWLRRSGVPRRGVALTRVSVEGGLLPWRVRKRIARALSRFPCRHVHVEPQKENFHGLKCEADAPGTSGQNLAA